MAAYTFDIRSVQADTQTLADMALQGSKTPGVQFTRADGGVFSSAAAGVSNLATGAALTTDTTFDAGSQMKMLTATLVLQLVAEGKLDLAKPVTAYLSANEVQGIPNVGTATIEQLLAMKSGIPNYTEYTDRSGNNIFNGILQNNPDKLFTVAEALNIVRGSSAIFAPGTNYDYSNTNYVLLGRAIEQVTGQSLEQAMQARIFKPAGMTQSTTLNWPVGDDRAHGYQTINGSLVDTTNVKIEYGGEGGLVTTTADMARFMDALFGQKILLTDAQLAKMTAPLHEDAGASGASEGFGLGMGVYQLNGETYYGFTGLSLSQLSTTWYAPKTGAIVSGVQNAPDNPEGGINELVYTAQSIQALATDAHLAALPNALTARDSMAVKGVSAADVTVAGPLLTVATTTINTRDATLSFTDGSALLRGTDGNDTLTVPVSAMTANNQLLAGSGNDSLTGGAGGDRFVPGAGNDWIDGGAGVDTLVLGGQRQDYGLSQAADGSWSIVGPDGSDYLRNIETLQFNDQAVALPAAAPIQKGALVYRFYHSGVQKHFLTASAEEAAAVRKAGTGYKDEGGMFYAAAASDSGQIDVFRLFDKLSGKHFYTASSQERDALLAQTRVVDYKRQKIWADEGVGFKAYGADYGPQEAVHRFFNPKTGDHLFTSSVSEINALGVSNYKHEGIAFWALT